MSNLTKVNNVFLPTTQSEAWDIANQFAKSQFCPAGYRGKPADVYLAMAYGTQMGLNPLLAVQNIAVINGKPSLYGDGVMALIQHPETESYEDGVDESDPNNLVAFCTVKRRGKTFHRTFSQQDAMKAKLWGKNVWASYPKRMLLARAKGFAIRDAYADLMMGMYTEEESRDMGIAKEAEPVNVTPAPAQIEATQGNAERVKGKLKKQAEKNKKQKASKAETIEAEPEIAHAEHSAEYAVLRQRLLNTLGSMENGKSISKDLGRRLEAKETEDEKVEELKVILAELGVDVSDTHTPDIFDGQEGGEEW